jgi:hypothetical protein
VYFKERLGAKTKSESYRENGRDIKEKSRENERNF